MFRHSIRVTKLTIIFSSLLCLFGSIRCEAGKVEQAVKRVVHDIDRFIRQSDPRTQVAVVYQPSVLAVGAHAEEVRESLINRLADVLSGRSGYVFYQDPETAERNIKEIFRLIEVAKNIADPEEQHEAITRLRRAIGRTPYRYLVATEILASNDYLTISGEVFSSSAGTVYRTTEQVKLSVAEAEASLVEGAAVYLLRRNEGAELSLQLNEELERFTFKEDFRVYGGILNARSANVWSEIGILTGKSGDRDLTGLEYSALDLSFDSQFSLWEGRRGGTFLGLGARDFEESYVGAFSGRTEVAIGTRTYSGGFGFYKGSINNGFLVGYWYELFETDDRSPDRFFSDQDEELYDGEAGVLGIVYRSTSIRWEAELRLLGKRGSIDGVASVLRGLRTDFDSYGIRVELDRRWERFGVGIFGATQNIEYKDSQQTELQGVRDIESMWIGLRLSYRLGD